MCGFFELMNSFTSAGAVPGRGVVTIHSHWSIETPGHDVPAAEREPSLNVHPYKNHCRYADQCQRGAGQAIAF